MERPPLDSDRARETPVREWTGTLVAEWTDRGLSEGDEQILRDAPKRLALMAIFGLALVVLSARPLAAVAYVALLGLFTLGSILWLRLRHRHAGRVTLLLAPDVLRVTRTSSDSAIDVKELQRSEAGLLTRHDWVGASSGYAQKLEMQDLAGRSRIELRDRLVAVRTAPFGIDLAARGIDPKRVPLAVLIGSWWPDPDLRATRAQRSRFVRHHLVDGAWAQPDLDGYAAWQVRRKAKEGLLVGGMGASVLTLIVFVVLSGSESQDSGNSWALPAIVGVGALCVAYGAWRVWPLRRALRLRSSSGRA